MNKLRQRKAFTIVEMVIVIAVIAVLAAVLIPTISGVIKQANVSADTQFAASLNVQLAMWEVDNGSIDSESDLRDAINDYYGDNFYETLTPKSGKYGYSYWYDVENKQVVLSTYEKLLEAAAEPALLADDGGNPFSPASPRNLTINGKYYFLMDQDGSEMGKLIKSFENLGNNEREEGGLKDPAEDYKDLINQLNEKAGDGDKLAELIQAKIKVTAIVTEFGVFRHAVEKVEYVHIPVSVTKLNKVNVFEYDGSDVSDPMPDAPISEKSDIQIELPSGVKVNAGGLTGFFNATDDTDLRTKTPELHVNATIDELKDIFEAASTDAVIVLPDASRYIMDADGIYRLPRTQGDTPAVGGLGMTSVNEIKIEYNDGNDKQGEDAGYFYTTNKTLYLAYDIGSAQLSLKDGISSSMVNWAVSDNAPIEVSPSGKITIVGTPNSLNTTATITATLKGNEEIADEITVHLVFPTMVSWTLGTAPYSAPVTNSAFDLTYTDTTDFDLALTGEGYTQAGYVKMNDTNLSIKFTTSGDLFKVVDNKKLVLDPTKIATNPTQDLTVTYGTADNTYVSQTYTVTVKDNSATPFENNTITGDVKMGDTYLFRVGNGNTFTLNKLFNSEKAPNKITLTIYDASKTSGTGTRDPIATSGSGFTATYTSELTKDTWATSTIKFSGTGVAIIEIVTDKGTATLAVEVVNGKNVTAAGEFTGATNYVVLNNITWGATPNTAISGTIYGNGFAINATKFSAFVNANDNTALFKLQGGTIDNLVINGPVYPELLYQSEASADKPYYVAGIYATGDVKITNSYISGFREPIMANGTSLYLDNTTLVGGNYANLWLQTGALTLNNVTTVQKPTTATIGSGTVLGAGIIAASGINASNVSIIGNLNQYNWVTQAQVSANMDSNVSSLINEFFQDTTLTHEVDGTNYINTGIVFQSTNGTVNNSKQTQGHGYTTETVSGSLMSVSFTGMVYTRTTEVTSIPTYGVYTPHAQSVTKPSFKHNLTLTNGEVRYSIDIPKGETAVLNASGYTVSKYTGQNIAVNITCPGATVNGKTITFSKAGTYTVTYSVEDNTFYNADGSKQTNNNVDTYTVTVVVSNSNHPNAKIDLSGLTKETKWVQSGFFTDYDYSAYFEVLGGLVITDYNEDGTPFTVTISASNLNGLTITASDSQVTGTSVDDAKYWMYDTLADNNKANKSVIFTYTYKGKNGNTVTAKSAAFTLKADAGSSSGGGGCVTPDTLVTLADGTQKEIQYVTYEDQLLVWNFNTGKYDVMPASIVMNHGYGYYTVATLNFSDGTTVNTINGHGFFDVAENKYVIIDESNAAEYIGHEFVKVNGDGYSTVTLESYSVSEQYTESWSILTATQYNCILEGMWTLTPAEVEGSPDYLMPFEIGADMKYDEAKMQADIEKYGLYTYEDFAEYCTYEQFVGFGFANFKVSVEKGYITWDGIEFLLNLHLGGNNK